MDNFVEISVLFCNERMRQLLNCAALVTVVPLGYFSLYFFIKFD